MIREQGWECPKCQRIWAPKIGACGACNTVDYSQLKAGSPTKTVYPRVLPPSFGPQWNWTSEDPSFLG